MEVPQGPLILDTVVRIDAYVMKRDKAPKPIFIELHTVAVGIGAQPR